MSESMNAQRLKELHEAVFCIAPLVVQEEHAHMRSPWQMVLGGLILPEIVKLDPDVLTSNPAYGKLMEQYDKDRVVDFFSPKPTVEIKETIKETIKEVPVIKEVVKEKIVKEIIKVPVPGTTVVVADGKFRRLKEKVDKVKRFERDIDSTDRDAIIRWWNQNQRLISSDDPACKSVTDLLNQIRPGVKPLSPMQIAGYFSYLCRLGQWTETERNNRIDSALKRGSITIAPGYSQDLLNEIILNWQRERADERARAEAHLKLRDARARGEKLTIKDPVDGAKTTTVLTPAPTPVSAPVPEENFDIKFM